MIFIEAKPVMMERSALSPIEYVSFDGDDKVWCIGVVHKPWLVEPPEARVWWFFCDATRFSPTKGFKAYYEFSEAYGPYDTIEGAREGLKDNRA